MVFATGFQAKVRSRENYSHGGGITYDGALRGIYTGGRFAAVLSTSYDSPDSQTALRMNGHQSRHGR